MRKCCYGIYTFLSACKKILTQKMPNTEYHKRAWQSFDKIMAYRANIGLGMLMFATITLPMTTS